MRQNHQQELIYMSMQSTNFLTQLTRSSPVTSSESTTDHVTIMVNQAYFCGKTVEIMWPNKWL